MMRVMDFIVEIQRRQRYLTDIPLLLHFALVTSHACPLSNVHENIRRLADDQCLASFAFTRDSQCRWSEYRRVAVAAFCTLVHAYSLHRAVAIFLVVGNVRIRNTCGLERKTYVFGATWDARMV